MLTAKELTGAPLISYVPKNRKLKKKISEPLEKERKSEFAARQRHSSEQSLTHLLSSAPVPSYYLGQNLYHKLLADQGLVYLQDFYRNPAFSILQRQTITSTFHHQNTNLRRENVSKSFDNLSDTFSMSSDESDNLIPRIIRPRRRRGAQLLSPYVSRRNPALDQRSNGFLLVFYLLSLLLTPGLSQAAQKKKLHQSTTAESWPPPCPCPPTAPTDTMSITLFQ